MSALTTAILVSCRVLCAQAEPETAPPPEAPPPPQEYAEDPLAEATEALLLEDYEAAAVAAYHALSATKASSEKYESAQFILGAALYGLQMYQGAAEIYFAVVEQRQNPALLPRALAELEIMARAALIDEGRLLRGVIIDANLATIPTETANFLTYYRGLSNLRLGYRRWSDADFAAIRGNGYYAQQARLVKAVTAVKDGKTDNAVQIIESLQKSGAVDPSIKERLVVMRARLLHEAGKTKEAIEEYKKVIETEETHAGELLLERAWAHFSQGDYHDAMGLLYALGAPSNQDLFLPGKYILRGLIYQKFCHFRAAKAAVREFRGRFADAVAALKAGRAAVTIPEIAAAAELWPEVTGHVIVRNAIIDEMAFLDELAPVFEDEGLMNYLLHLYGLLQKRSDREYARALESGAGWVAEELLESFEQANLLHYEVSVSIFKAFTPSAGGEVKQRKPAEVVPGGGDQIYYQFDTEYWTDELPDMRFLIQDRCVE